MKKISLTIFLLILNLFVFASQSHAAGITVPISDSENYNLIIVGESDSDTLGHTRASTGSRTYTDINKDGKLDLVIGAANVSKNGKNNSGSIYIISGDILDNYSGTGNVLDLANTNNYNLRIDGSAAEEKLTSSAGVIFGDINNDGEEDMLISSSYYNSIQGQAYVLYSEKFKSYLGSLGNVIDLSNTSNYNLLIRGEGAGDTLSNLSLNLVDLDNDQKLDILLEAHHTDYNSRAESGSVYIFFNTLLDDFSGSGNLLEVSNTSNFSVRFDGEEAGITLGGGAITTGDYNNDGNLDVIIGTDYSNFNSRTRSGSIWIIDNSIVSSLAGTSGNILDMLDSSNWVVRLDGAEAQDRITYANNLIFKDVTGDGLGDFIIGSFNSDHNSLTDSGSLWIIENSVFSSFTGSGNIVDLADGSNIKTRIDGESAGDKLSLSSFDVLDLDNNGINDIYASSYSATSGYIYVFYDSLFNSWATGSTHSLSSSDSYSLRYEGASSGDRLNWQSGSYGDFNNDGQIDFVFNARQYDYGSRLNAGAYYLVYNFPHTIDNTPANIIKNRTNITIKGEINAPNSTTTISGVQYSINSNSPSGSTWENCSANDGSFDSSSEKFSCSLDTSSTQEHTIFLRALDEHGIYTAIGSYTTVKYNAEENNPSCNTLMPTIAPKIFQIDTKQNTATVFFVPVLGVKDYYLAYSVNENAENHGTQFSVHDNGVAKYTVNSLTANTKYFFKVRGNNNCVIGDWSNIFSSMTLANFATIPNNLSTKSFESSSSAYLNTLPTISNQKRQEHIQEKNIEIKQTEVIKKHGILSEIIDIITTLLGKILN